MNSLEEKNYYELLGVERSASEDEIRASYKELVRIFHPDSNFFSEIVDDHVDGAEADAFKAITEAYKTLTDKSKREQYDEKLPPVLKDWGNGGEQMAPQVVAAGVNDWSSRGVPATMDKAIRNRTFGVGQQVSAEHEREIQSVLSVRDLFYQRKGFLARILELFGL